MAVISLSSFEKFLKQKYESSLEKVSCYRLLKANTCEVRSLLPAEIVKFVPMEASVVDMELKLPQQSIQFTVYSNPVEGSPAYIVYKNTAPSVVVDNWKHARLLPVPVIFCYTNEIEASRYALEPAQLRHEENVNIHLDALRQALSEFETTLHDDEETLVPPAVAVDVIVHCHSTEASHLVNLSVPLDSTLEALAQLITAELAVLNCEVLAEQPDNAYPTGEVGFQQLLVGAGKRIVDIHVDPSMSLVIHIHHKAHSSYAQLQGRYSDFRGRPRETNKPKTKRTFVYPQQKDVARSLENRISEIVQQQGSKFERFRVVFLSSPGVKSLQRQTVERITDYFQELQSSKAVGCEHIMECLVDDEYPVLLPNEQGHWGSVWQSFTGLVPSKGRVTVAPDSVAAVDDDTTMYLVVVDECHFATNYNGLIQKWLYGPQMNKRRNVFYLLVSATPHNILSFHSRVPETYNLNVDIKSHEQLAKQLSAGEPVTQIMVTYRGIELVPDSPSAYRKYAIVRALDKQGRVCDKAVKLLEEADTGMLAIDLGSSFPEASVISWKDEESADVRSTRQRDELRRKFIDKELVSPSIARAGMPVIVTVQVQFNKTPPSHDVEVVSLHLKPVAYEGQKSSLYRDVDKIPFQRFDQRSAVASVNEKKHVYLQFSVPEILHKGKGEVLHGKTACVLECNLIVQGQRVQVRLDFHYAGCTGLACAESLCSAAERPYWSIDFYMATMHLGNAVDNTGVVPASAADQAIPAVDVRSRIRCETTMTEFSELVCDNHITNDQVALALLADYVVSLLFFAFYLRESESGFQMDDSAALCFFTECRAQDAKLLQRVKSMTKGNKQGEYNWDQLCAARVGTLVLPSGATKATLSERAAQMFERKAEVHQKLLDKAKDIALNGENSSHLSETDRIMFSLLLRSQQRPFGSFHVVKVANTAVGELFVETLRGLCVKLNLQNRFAVLPDFGDFALRDVDGAYFYSKIVNNIVCNCGCDSFKQKERDDTTPHHQVRKCETCGHEHNTMRTYEDLCIPALLVLVNKGSLGDTFADSLTCFDLRCQRTSGGFELDSLIQELGRLCNHRGDIKRIEDLPYTLLYGKCGLNGIPTSNILKLLHSAAFQEDIKCSASERLVLNADLFDHKRETLVQHYRGSTQVYSKAVLKLQSAPPGSADKSRTQASILTSLNLPERMNHGAFHSYDDLLILSDGMIKPRVRPLDMGEHLSGEKLQSLQSELDAFYNANCVVLRAHPQVGKTGAFLYLCKLLHKRFNVVEEVVQPVEYVPVICKATDVGSLSEFWRENISRPYWLAVKAGFARFHLNPLIAVKSILGGKYLVRRARERLGRIWDAVRGDKTVRYADVCNIIKASEDLHPWEQALLMQAIDRKTAPSSVGWRVLEFASPCGHLKPDLWEHLRDILLFDHCSESDRKLFASVDMFCQHLQLQPVTDCKKCNGWSLSPASGSISIAKPQKTSLSLPRKAVLEAERSLADTLRARPPNRYEPESEKQSLLFHVNPPERSGVANFTVEFSTSSPRLLPICEQVSARQRDDSVKLGRPADANDKTPHCWLFSPSHREHNSRLMWDNDCVPVHELPVMVIVVESTLFRTYQRLYGKTHLVMSLPVTLLDSTSKQPLEMSIGLKRLVIQLVASQLGLDDIHMWDDNVERVYKTTVQPVVAQAPAVVVPGQPKQVLMCESAVSPVEILLELERVKHAQQQIAAPRLQAEGCIAAETWPLLFGNGCEPTISHQFTGPRSLYGVIGVNKDIRLRKVGYPYNFTVSAYSVMLLNVRDTVDRGIFFPPIATKEDVRFNLRCIEAGFAVVKCKRLRIQKTHNALNRKLNTAIPLQLPQPSLIRLADSVRLVNTTAIDSRRIDKQLLHEWVDHTGLKMQRQFIGDDVVPADFFTDAEPFRRSGQLNSRLLIETARSSTAEHCKDLLQDIATSHFAIVTPEMLCKGLDLTGDVNIGQLRAAFNQKLTQTNLTIYYTRDVDAVPFSVQTSSGTEWPSLLVCDMVGDALSTSPALPVSTPQTPLSVSSIMPNVLLSPTTIQQRRVLAADANTIVGSVSPKPAHKRKLPTVVAAAAAVIVATSAPDVSTSADKGSVTTVPADSAAVKQKKSRAKRASGDEVQASSKKAKSETSDPPPKRTDAIKPLATKKKVASAASEDQVPSKKAKSASADPPPVAAAKPADDGKPKVVIGDDKKKAKPANADPPAAAVTKPADEGKPPRMPKKKVTSAADVQTLSKKAKVATPAEASSADPMSVDPPASQPVSGVECLGTVVYDREKYHDERYIYPVGYRAVVSRASVLELGKKEEYVCEILDGGDAPLFRVSLKSDPTHRFEGLTLTAAAKAVMLKADSLKPEAERRKSGASVSGPEFFRLVAAQDQIRALPNAEKCSRYIGTKAIAETKKRKISVEPVASAAEPAPMVATAVAEKQLSEPPASQVRPQAECIQQSCVVDYGVIELLPAFHTRDCIYPVGYTVHGYHYDVYSPGEITHYLMRILKDEKGQVPIFEISLLRDRNACWRASTPEDATSMLLDALVDPFAGESYSLRSSDVTVRRLWMLHVRSDRETLEAELLKDHQLANYVRLSSSVGRVHPPIAPRTLFESFAARLRRRLPEKAPTAKTVLAEFAKTFPQNTLVDYDESDLNCFGKQCTMYKSYSDVKVSRPAQESADSIVARVNRLFRPIPARKVDKSALSLPIQLGPQLKIWSLGSIYDYGGFKVPALLPAGYCAEFYHSSTKLRFFLKVEDSSDLKCTVEITVNGVNVDGCSVLDAVSKLRCHLTPDVFQSVVECNWGLDDPSLTRSLPGMNGVATFAGTLTITEELPEAISSQFFPKFDAFDNFARRNRSDKISTEKFDEFVSRSLWKDTSTIAFTTVAEQMLAKWQNHCKQHAIAAQPSITPELALQRVVHFYVDRSARSARGSIVLEEIGDVAYWAKRCPETAPSVYPNGFRCRRSLPDILLPRSSAAIVPYVLSISYQDDRPRFSIVHSCDSTTRWEGASSDAVMSGFYAAVAAVQEQHDILPVVKPRTKGDLFFGVLTSGVLDLLPRMPGGETLVAARPAPEPIMVDDVSSSSDEDSSDEDSGSGTELTDSDSSIEVGKVVSLGTIDPLPAFHTRYRIYPVGYTVVAHFFDIYNPTKKTRYLMQILKQDNVPVFQISLLRDSRVYWRAATPEDATYLLVQSVISLGKHDLADGYEALDDLNYRLWLLVKYGSRSKIEGLLGETTLSNYVRLEDQGQDAVPAPVPLRSLFERFYVRKYLCAVPSRSLPDKIASILKRLLDQQDVFEPQYLRDKTYFAGVCESYQDRTGKRVKLLERSEKDALVNSRRMSVCVAPPKTNKTEIKLPLKSGDVTVWQLGDVVDYPSFKQGSTILTDTILTDGYHAELKSEQLPWRMMLLISSTKSLQCRFVLKVNDATFEGSTLEEVLSELVFASSPRYREDLQLCTFGLTDPTVVRALHCLPGMDGITSGGPVPITSSLPAHIVDFMEDSQDESIWAELTDATEEEFARSAQYFAKLTIPYQDACKEALKQWGSSPGRQISKERALELVFKLSLPASRINGGIRLLSLGDVARGVRYSGSAAPTVVYPNGYKCYRKYADIDLPGSDCEVDYQLSIVYKQGTPTFVIQHRANEKRKWKGETAAAVVIKFHEALIKAQKKADNRNPVKRKNTMDAANMFFGVTAKPVVMLMRRMPGGDVIPVPATKSKPAAATPGATPDLPDVPEVELSTEKPAKKAKTVSKKGAAT
eukprot:TRINITY_DN288_c0_g1_i1.p1 TRINITY_DN288_c0_g1~~TRINITY_DN288_c0_g1_i1.p1  ORF type:complete len:3741 (+),score=673.98 TRINITY_DN288_c0_g1_i1:115-11337(+)